MIKKITQIACTLAITLFLISCRDTKQKIQAYVNTFNNSSELFKSDIISGAAAKAFLNEKKVEIKIDTNLEPNPSMKSIYAQMLPGLMGEMLGKDHASMDLIEEGVLFEIYFLANDASVLAESKVDSKELKKILSIKKSEPKGIKDILNPESSADSELQQMLTVMNRSMPIVNEDGTKIIKIEVNKENQVVYKIEVPKQYASVLKGEGAKAIMKESILRSSDLKTIIGSIKRYGISTIKYEYIDDKGKPVNDVILTEKDLK